MIRTNQKQKHFEKEALQSILENSVTIINNLYTCGKIPVSLARAGYTVIVTGSKKRLDPFERYSKTIKSFDKSMVAFSKILPYHSNNYKILFINYSSELINKLLASENQNMVLIVEDSYNCLEAGLLFALVHKLMSDGKKIKLVVLNKIDKYTNKLSDYFDNAKILEYPDRHYVTFIQEPANRMEHIILSQFKVHSRRNILILLQNQEEIEKLSKQLNILKNKMNINANIICSNYSYKDLDPFALNVIIATYVAPDTSIDFDIVIDNGFQAVKKNINGVLTYKIRNISKAEISQRQRIAGLYSPGVYYLFSDFDYERRKEVSKEWDYDFDNIILSLIKYNIDIKSLQFPHNSYKFFISCSLNLLMKIDAIDSNTQITEIGKEISEIPIEVNFSRTFIEARKYGAEFDALIFWIIIHFKWFSNSNISSHESKSDLFLQITSLKQLYIHGKYPQVDYINYKKICGLIKNLCDYLKVKPYFDTKINELKTCIAVGFPDYLFICIRSIGYKNSISNTVRYLYTNSSLYAKGYRYIVGIPADIIDDYNNTSFSRILYPTAYTLEEINCFSKWFISGLSISDNNVFENQMYNGIIITSNLLGNVQELKKIYPEDFHEEKEIDEESGKTFICSYFRNLKISSREYVKI